jgi:hypothetical protein
MTAVNAVPLVAGLVYVSGVVVGLALTDARPLTRVALALLWPLGPLAFVATIAILVASSAIAFPAVGVLMAAGATLWWIFS